MIAESRTLASSGRPVELAMPPLFSIVSRAGRTPDPITAAVLLMLHAEGLLPQDDGELFLSTAQRVAGMYAVASLCLQSPILVLDRKPDAAAGEIGEQDISFLEVKEIYWNFFLGYAHPSPGAPVDPADAPGLPGGVGAGGDEPQPAE